jgi:hypothetical protein
MADKPIRQTEDHSELLTELDAAGGAAQWAGARSGLIRCVFEHKQRQESETRGRKSCFERAAMQAARPGRAAQDEYG